MNAPNPHDGVAKQMPSLATDNGAELDNWIVHAPVTGGLRTLAQS
jgi:hypothetical protein